MVPSENGPSMYVFAESGPSQISKHMHAVSTGPSPSASLATVEYLDV